MSESNKIKLGGFPPIFEIVSTIKSKEFKPNKILSIRDILDKSNLNRLNSRTVNKNKVKNSEK